MAVAALHKAFVHLVVKGHIELRLLVGVALEAKRRLRGLQQLLFLAVVNAVATDAAHIGLGVRRALKVGMRARVAAQAGRVHFFGEALAGLKILVTSPPPSTCALPGPWQLSQVAPAAVLHRHLGVRIVREFLGHLFVAGGADFADPQSLPERRPWPVAWPAFAVAPALGAARQVAAQNMLAPSINTKQARSPGHFPGAAPIDNCVTGPLCA